MNEIVVHTQLFFGKLLTFSALKSPLSES